MSKERSLRFAKTSTPGIQTNRLKVSSLPPLSNEQRKEYKNKKKAVVIQYRNSRVGAVFEAILKDTLKISKAGLFLQNLHEAYPINLQVVGSTSRELNRKYGHPFPRKLTDAPGNYS